MRLTRREFITLTIATAVGLGSVTKILQLIDKTLKTTDETLTGREEGGRILSEDAAVIGSMVSAVFIVLPPEKTDHYERMVAVRSRERKGLFDRYMQTATELRRRAIVEFQSSFTELKVDSRRQLIQAEIEHLLTSAQTSSLSVHIPIVETITDLLRFYMYTDAYLVLGYKAWPGTPKGLLDYRHSP